MERLCFLDTGDKSEHLNRDDFILQFLIAPASIHVAFKTRQAALQILREYKKKRKRSASEMAAEKKPEGIPAATRILI